MVEKKQNKKTVSSKKKNLKEVNKNKEAKGNSKVNKTQASTKTVKKQNEGKNIKRKQADEKSARIKKAKKTRQILTWTILIGMLAGILIFLCKSEIFNICNIEIVGNNQISQETVSELSQIRLENNIFLTNTTKAENRISENPYIKNVKITRMLPDKIKIEITEKQKSYMLQTDEGIAYVDKNGDILEISQNILDNLILLQGYSTLKEEIQPGKKLNEKDLGRLEDLQQIFRSAEKIQIKDQIASINIQDKNDYIINLPAYKKIVYIGDTSNLATKMLRTKDILDKTMEIEGKIFVNGEFNKGFDPYFREEPNN